MIEFMNCVELQNKLFKRLVERLRNQGFEEDYILELLLHLMD